MSINFTIRNGNLHIGEGDGNLTLWEGGFDGASIVQIVQLKDSDSCLVLLDPGAKQTTFKNLLKVASNGSIIWKAELPQSHDAFTKIIIEGGSIEATTWNGLRVKLDLGTGKVLGTRFVK